MLHRLIAIYFYCVLQKSWWSLLAVLSVAAVLATYLPQLKIDASSDSLTLEYDRDLDYSREISQRYQSGDFLFLTYKPKGDLLAPETLKHLAALRDDLLKVEGVSGASSILDVPLLYSPPITLTEVTSAVKTLTSDNVDYDLARKEFLESPIYKDMLLGPDGKTTAILLNLTTDNDFIALVRERDGLRLKRDTQGLSLQEQQQLEEVSRTFLDYRTQAAKLSYQRVEVIRAIAGQYQGEADIFLGGVSMITADIVDFIRSDIVVFGLGIVVFIILILSIIFRQWQYVVLPLLTCLLTLVAMLGFLALVDWRLTIISSNFVPLLLIICLMITIHLTVRYREIRAQGSGAAHADQVRATMAAMFKPCFYTVLTTVVAFASLVVSGIRPVIDFGWMMTIGLVLAFVLAFIVVPAGLMLLPLAKSHQREDKSAAFTLRFARFTERRGRLIMLIGAVGAVISAFGMSRLEVENRFIDYFHSSTEIHQGMLVIDQQLGGTISLDVILDKAPAPTSVATPLPVEDDEFFDEDPFAPPPLSATTTDGAVGDDSFSDDDPFGDEDLFGEAASSTTVSNYWFTQAGLTRVNEVHRYLESLSEVGKVQSLAMVYQVAADLNGKPLNDFELALVAKALPDEVNDFLISPYLADDREQTRITLRVKETDPQLRRADLLAKIQRHLTEEMGFAPENVHLTGVLVLYNNMLQSLFTSQILTLGAVFLGIMLMFLLLFRSWGLALIALTPNMLAALAVLGGMGLMGIPLDMMTITIAAIAVGIGVDDAIHYIYRYRREFAREKNYIKAMHNAHASIGRAMYYTSITIIVGFSILSLSKFIPSIYFGLLTGLAMLAAIIASLTLLPQLLLLTKPLGPEARP